MIDDDRVERMAREYEMSPLLARKLLEEAREQPAAVLVRHRRYRALTGGVADGQSEVKTVPGNQERVGFD